MQLLFPTWIARQGHFQLIFATKLTHQTEIKGLTHWVVYTEGHQVLAFDIVRNTAPIPMITGLTDARAVAIDTNQDYLFVAV